MYWIVDALCFAIGVTAFVLSFTEDRHRYAWIGPVWIVLYPLLT
jgi:hypothetical protein